MYRIKKRMEIAGSHHLYLPYESKCNKIHGHNWVITVEVEWEALNRDGMVLDFSAIKAVVNQLDHKHLNDILEKDPPTAECIAQWIATQLTNEILATNYDTGLLNMFGRPRVRSVTVQESEGNELCYIP